MKDYGKKLQRQIRDKVNEYAKIARDMVKEELGRYNDPSLGKGKVKATAPVVADIGGMITQDLIAEGNKVWVLEYGRGSEADTDPASNPFIDEYINSKDFNKWRLANGFAITGRERGEYFDLDNNLRKSTGSAVGINLEQWHSTKEYYPIPPFRIIDKILNGDGDSGLLRELREALCDVVYEVYAEDMIANLKEEVIIKL